MLLQVRPFTGKRKRPKAVLLEIAFDLRRANPMLFAGMKLAQNYRGVCAFSAERTGAVPNTCITMAMLAAPHPSFSCLMNGTSSHMAGVAAAKAKPQRQKKNNRSLRLRLEHTNCL